MTKQDLLLLLSPFPDDTPIVLRKNQWIAKPLLKQDLSKILGNYWSDQIEHDHFVITPGVGSDTQVIIINVEQSLNR